MKIKDVVCAADSTGFYFDDQRAIKRGAGHDGMFYIGQPVTEGFSAVRMKGEAVSVMIVLEDGQIAFGDCAAVQYSGAGGRDPLFLAKDFIPIIEQYVRPMLLGREADDFRGLCAQMEAIEVNGKRLHTAIRYGVSQAILDAVAKATGRLMCEVVADEYGCTVSQTPIPIFTQSGDDRYDNADKMIIKRAQVLPHALINNVQTKLGEHGEKLLEYVKWLRDRILTMRADESYQPVLHIDVYGTIGAAFGNNNYAAMADYLAELEQAAKPFHLRIEGPMDCDCDRETQIVALAGLTAELDRRGIQVELVADEWCNTLEDIREFADRRAGHMVQIKTPDLGGINNTIEAVLYCKAHGIGAYQGGTCNETDRSAQVCVHCAMATQPVQILAKPGINTVSDLKGKTIYSTGQGSTPEYALNLVLEKNGLTVGEDVTVVYKTDNSEIAPLLASGEAQVALLPQPFVTSVMGQNETLRVALDMTEEWDKATDGASGLTMGCVVVRTEFAQQNKEALDLFLDEYERSVQTVTSAEGLEHAAQLAEQYNIVKAPVARKAIPACNIVFVQGEQMQQIAGGFLEVLYQANPKSVGGKLPDANFYYNR